LFFERKETLHLSALPRNGLKDGYPVSDARAFHFVHGVGWIFFMTMRRLKTKKFIKQAILNTAILCKTARKMTRDVPRIFMYHRFAAEPDALGRKVDKKTLEWQLRHLKSGWNIMTLGDYLKRKQTKPIPRNCVVITADDGYLDFYEVAFPLLKSYGIPATLFVTVNFVDQKIWLWHDRLWFALMKTMKKVQGFNFKGVDFAVDLNGTASMLRTWSRMSAFCTAASDEEKWNFIHHVEKIFDSECPAQPVQEFKAVTWEQLVEMQNDKIEIGSHTLNHPILTKVSTKELHNEVLQSKRELEKKLETEIGSFCYPNGQETDFDETVIQKVKEAGYRGAVTTELPDGNDYGDYRIARYAAGNDQSDFLWKLNGFEYLVEASKRKTARFQTPY
jgi:peptidoglycan/xylan/chitin deacetylase (PgdA/CDA1 family)